MNVFLAIPGLANQEKGTVEIDRTFAYSGGV
jgi:hypothetical protein